MFFSEPKREHRRKRGERKDPPRLGASQEGKGRSGDWPQKKKGEARGKGKEWARAPSEKSWREEKDRKRESVGGGKR